MRVLLTTLNAKYIHVNLALRYLRACCRDLPHTFILDEFTINDRPEHIAAAIYRHRPDLAAFSCYIWNIEPTLAVIRILKTVRPELIVLCGGPEVSFDMEEFLGRHPEIDLVISGEGEGSFRILMEQLAKDAAPGNNPFPGSTRNPDRGNLDAIPFPYAEDLATGTGNLSQRTVYYETSRGCPFACGFCLSSTTSGLRYFSLERVKDDLQQLLAAGIREIKFVDRTFNAHKKRALAIWEFLVSLKPRARFYFEIAADRLDDDMLAFLRRVPPGLFQFEIGVQTIDPEVNARCHRRQDWERLSANVRRLQEAGNIRLHLDLIAGLPGETYTGVAKSFDAIAALKPYEIQLGFLKLLKGTPLRARAREYGYLFLDRPPYEVLAGSAISYEEMLRLHSVENMLHHYGNSHLADHAFDYLVQRAFGGSHFNCYEALAAWWEEQCLSRRGHSQRDLFNLLAAFAAGLARENDGFDAAPYLLEATPHLSSSPAPASGRVAPVAAAGSGDAAETPAAAARENNGCPYNPAAAERAAADEASGQAGPFPASLCPSGRVRPGCSRPLTPSGLERFYQLLKFDFLCRDRSRNYPAWMPPSTLSELERSDLLDRVADPGFREKYMPGLKNETPAGIRRHGFIELFPCHPDRPEADEVTLVFFYYGPGNSGADVYYLQVSPSAGTDYYW